MLDEPASAPTGETGAGSAAGAPPEPTGERTAIDGGGAFWRDGAGVWRYAQGGDAVPGAHDLTLGELFDPPVRVVAGDDGAASAERLVPRSWARRSAGHPLTWVYDFATLGGREDIAVPEVTWAERASTVVAMAAPELHPHNLQGIDAVAGLLGVTPSTVRSYLARDQMPEPIARLGRAPVWSRPVIERWLPSRRRHALGHRSSTTGE